MRPSISFFLPAPSTIVVFSLEIDTFLAPEHLQGDVLKLDAEVFGDDLATAEDGDVLEHGLATVAEARRLHGCDLEAAADIRDILKRAAGPVE